MEWLLRDSADVVVIETGANDGLRGVHPDSLRANLRAIVREVRTGKPGATVIIAGMQAPPNMGAEYTRRFRGLYGEVARESGALLVPFLLDGVAGNAALNQGDGIHPNAAGAVVVAENVWRVLLAALR
jgi:acyl-CoA thioesterase-1